MPISDHVKTPSRSFVNLNTFALIVNVVSSSSSPSPSPPLTPGDCVRANPSSSNEPSVAGVSLRDAAAEDGSKNADTALAGAGAGVLAFVDAGVESAVPPPAGAAGPEADVDVVDADPNPKTEPGAVVVDVVACDEVREGEPNEKPTMLPALGGGDDPLLPPPGATPKPNCAGVVADAAEPKANGDGFEGTPNGAPPNTLVGGVAANLSFSLLSLLSFSSADFVVVEALKMLLEPDKLVLAPPKRVAPGASEKANGPGGGADNAGLSFSLSFSSGASLSVPKSVDVFGGFPKSKVLVLGRLVPPPPREKGLEVLVDANAPKEGGFSEGVLDSASLDVADLNGDSEDPKPEKGEDEAADTSLGSEDGGAVEERLKGDGLVLPAALGVNPVAESGDCPKPEKPDGGTGIVAGVEPDCLRKGIWAAGTEGLLGGLGALCVLDLPS